MDVKREYSLACGVRVYMTENEIRLRKGIWNFWELDINLNGENEKLKLKLKEMFKRLQKEGSINIEEICRDLTPIDATKVYKLVEEMVKGGLLLTREKSSDKLYSLVNMLLGYRYPGLEFNNSPQIMFFSDAEHPKEVANDISSRLGVSTEILPPDVFLELGKMDLTTKVDYLEYRRELDKWSRYFSKYDCLAGCLREPNMVFLRNLNRVLVEIEKPLSLGIIDGPFIHILTLHPPQTGCIECFEHRVMARLEDLTAYHEFIHYQNVSKASVCDYAPIAHILTAIVISDALLMGTVGKSKFIGRVLSIYLPTLEIQVEDVLRVPYCPACGAISKGRAKEMYVSSRAIIQKLLEEIEISEGDNNE